VDEPVKILANRYELGGIIGRGGMAEVHIGYDRRLGRTVAIKVLRSDLARDPSFINRFRREAQAAASLNHPAIVAVYDTGEEAGVEATGNQAHVPFIVMEYVEGHTVRDVLRDGQPLPLEEALDITVGVLSALAYSHQAGIVHRDIKPANVMLTTTGAVKVMDFGIARAVADSAATMTQTQAVIGTAQYLSPEQARGEQVDARTDLYSAGCLLFELLTGRPPFMADSMVAVAYQHVREQPPLPSSLNGVVPDALDRIVNKALTKDRDARYQTSAEFRADLEALQRGTQVMAPAVSAAGSAYAATQVMAPTRTGATSIMESTPAGAGRSPWQQTGVPTDVAKTDDVDEPRSKRWLIILLSAVGVLAVGLILMFVLANKGGGSISVPDVVGMQADAAATALEDAGFNAVKEAVSDPSVPENEVIKTDPAAHTLKPVGSAVHYYVSTGPGNTKVPDVSSMTAEEATAELEKAGLKVSPNQVQDDTGAQKKGLVVSTDPPKETEVKSGDTITLYISSGRVKVVDVVGLTQAEAIKQLEDQSLTVVIEKKETEDGPEDTVIEMSVAKDQLVDMGSTVTITVAVAPKSGVIPTGLVGMTYDDVVKRLKDAGFSGPFNKQTSPSDKPVGQVVSVNPATGTYPLDQAFTITVSGGATPGPGPTDLLPPGP
jgi:eukaryotic-like serine/threonine-protein kinase